MTLRKKAGRIVAGWLKTERDYGWLWGDGIDKADANLVGTWLFLKPMERDGHSLAKELKLRGYDMTTIKFSIDKLPVKHKDTQ